MLPVILYPAHKGSRAFEGDEPRKQRRSEMIARIWHGRTKASDAKVYTEYLYQSGIPDYRRTPGNRGAWILKRIEGDDCAHLARPNQGKRRQMLHRVSISDRHTRLPADARQSRRLDIEAKQG